MWIRRPDKAKNFQYVFSPPITCTKKEATYVLSLHQTFQFWNKCIIITTVQMHPHSIHTAIIMVYIMAENIKPREY
jgi:hypothetical protein